MHTSSTSRTGRQALALLALCLATPWALADLTLYPTRVVLEKNQRAAQVELMNTGTAPETYRIRLVNRRMSETGDFSVITEAGPGDLLADTMLQYSPRQITIQPGSSQTVRILVRKPASLPPGEYRSHLQFDRVAEVSAADSVETLRTPADPPIGVVITALVGASIPVIVRQGDTDAEVTLAGLALVPASGDTPPALTFQMLRTGSRSVYGDLVVTFASESGTPVELARAGALAVYVPNPLRRGRMVLQLPAGTVLAKGHLRLQYRERVEAGGKLLAEATVAVP